MAVGFDHMHLRSLDPEAAGKFYVENLGATLVGREDRNGALRVTVAIDGVRMFLEEVKPGIGAPPPAPFLGLEHFGLRVGDLETLAAKLKANGVHFFDGPREARPGLKIAFIRGPDNVRIELLERGQG
jgi:catechol 2,3-dioxygenase-like lactoylglutathione lyase family enzyme